MDNIGTTARAARLHLRGLYLASTALVGLLVRPVDRPDAPHLASSPWLSHARLARLLALAIEAPASLLARLNPMRIRKVRPAARVGRRKWREAVLAAVAAASLTAASTTHAQTWNGTTADYNTDGNWSPNGAPIAQGQSATFANTGSAAVNVSAQIAPDAWTFANNAQSYTITGAGVNFGGTGITNNAAAGTTISIANAIGGTGGVTQAGAGVLTLAGVNTYTGGTNVSGGTLIAQNTGNAFGSSGIVAISSGATVELNSTGNNGYTIAPNTFTGAGTIEKTGTGVITFGGNGGDTNISLSQGGLINVREGTLGGSSSGQGIWTNNRGSLNVEAGATLNTVEAAVFIDALTGAGTYSGGFDGTRTTTIGVADGTGTFSGTLTDNAGAGALAIVKTGTGTQVLTGANTYTGATTISGGTLQIGGTVGGIVGGATGSLAAGSAVTVESGATLALARTGMLAFGNNVSGAGAVTVRGGTATGDLITLSGALTQTGGFTVANAANVFLSGQINPATGTAVTIAAAGGTLTNQNGGVISSVDGRGVSLTAGGALDNQLGGTIRHTDTADNGVGNGAAVYASTDLTLTNAGTINTAAAGANDGVTVLGVATITNTGTRAKGALTGGLIQAANASGLALVGAGSSVTNSGEIRGGNDVNFGVGVAFSNGGQVTNLADGLITAGQRGIASSGGTITLDNAGTVTGTSDTGVRGSGASVVAVNRTGGSITGANGIYVNEGNAISLVNAGSITATDGVGVGGQGNSGVFAITNANGATIQGGGAGGAAQGIQLNAAAGSRVDNYGTIARGGMGTPDAINGQNNDYAINLFAGSTVDGAISLGSGNNTISLYTGVVGASAVTVADPVLGGANTVTARGAGTFAAAVVNGNINLGGGNNTLNLRGTGTYDGVTGTNTTGARGALDISTVSGLTTLNKQDSGTFVLTGAYDGALTTNVTGGSLIAQNTGDAFGSSGTVAISSGATVELNVTTGNDIFQAAHTFSGAGTIAKTGAGRFNIGGGNGDINIALDAGGLIDVQAGALQGSNSFRGIWTNNKGSLNIESGATFDGVEGTIFVDRLTGAGTLQGGFSGPATTTIGIADGSSTFTGTIQDSSANGQLALTKAGTGTQTLSGISTYSGATTISGGTLQAGSTNGFSANSAFTVNAATLDLGGFSNTVGALAGAGTVTNSGTAAATLTTGGLAQSPTFSGIIQNGNATTALTKTGGGTLTLTGTNTYTGGTTISAGTLQLGNGGTTGSITGNVTNNGTLAFARSDTSTFGNAVSGTGAVNQIGTGTTILTASNTYTGGTTISAGTLQLGNGGTTGSITGNVVDNANLAFNRSDVVTFSGAISGTGNVQQNGSGTTILTGASTYSGSTVINAGTLQVDGSIFSPNLTVNNGGTLSGIGKIGDPLIAAGGTLAPMSWARPICRAAPCAFWPAPASTV